MDITLTQRLLDTMLADILPLTEAEVEKGNKVFGAALLKKSDFSTYLAATNNEIESPLHHGEMHLLKHYYDIPEADRIGVNDLIFLSSHEPCSLCLSAITWSGFDNFYYFFSHVDSSQEFGIPHDLKILKEVFNLDPGQYRSENAFWTCHSIPAWVEASKISLPTDTQAQLNEKINEIETRYSAASMCYQLGKDNNNIPLN